jgi:hypothetical protein
MKLKSELEFFDGIAKQKVLFISHEKYLQATSPEGGVKFCTDEYLALIKLKFEITKVSVCYTKKWSYRLKKKLGLSAYDEYDPKGYYLLLKEYLESKDVNYVFLNLTNTSPFAEFIKKNWPHVKVILCSHGNESGDHLHSISFHNNYQGILRTTAIFSLGKMLIKESFYRKYIDVVLTVSDVEVGIEKWLGASRILMVPRYIEVKTLARKPVLGRVGFLADLSHEPNYFGIKEVCEALQKNNITNTTIHLVGGGKERGTILAEQYSFVKYIGYLNEEQLGDELSSWTFALNPVFYYSRGVSTKLGKALGMGLAVITTDKGMRGYEWNEGVIPICNDASEMAWLIKKLAGDSNEIEKYNNEVVKIQLSNTSLNETAEKMFRLL